MTKGVKSRGVLERRRAAWQGGPARVPTLLHDLQDTIATRVVANRCAPSTNKPAEQICATPDPPHTYAHPARLILILSLAPTIGLGIGRFAYALVLPDMRDALAGRIRRPAS